MNRVLELTCAGLLAMTMAVAAGPGCSKKSAGSSAALRVYTAPQWPELEVKSLAYLGARNTSGQATALEQASRLIAAEIRGSQSDYIVLGDATVEERAAAAGKGELLEKVRRVWQSDQLVDQFLAKELCETLGVDGLLVAELSDWTEYRIDPVQEGTSWSRVGVGLYVYSGKTGLLVWGADRTLRKDSLPYRPTGGDAELAGAKVGSTSEREKEERRENRLNNVPEPPPIEEVAREVMAEVLGGLPPR